LITLSANAQSKLPPLSENASLEETEKWLKIAVEKFSLNGNYSLKFNDYRLNYSVSSLYFFDVSTDKLTIPLNQQGINNFPTNSGSGGCILYPKTWRYSLELKNLGNIF